MSNFSFVLFLSFISFVYTYVCIFLYVFHVLICPRRGLFSINNAGGENGRIHFACTMYAVLSRHTFRIELKLVPGRVVLFYLR